MPLFIALNATLPLEALHVNVVGVEVEEYVAFRVVDWQIGEGKDTLNVRDVGELKVISSTANEGSVPMPSSLFTHLNAIFTEEATDSSAANQDELLAYLSSDLNEVEIYSEIQN